MQLKREIYDDDVNGVQTYYCFCRPRRREWLIVLAATNLKARSGRIEAISLGICDRSGHGSPSKGPLEAETRGNTAPRCAICPSPPGRSHRRLCRFRAASNLFYRIAAESTEAPVSLEVASVSVGSVYLGSSPCHVRRRLGKSQFGI